MLSLAKLAGTDQRYYLEQARGNVDHAGSVSSGVEDYYLLGPEAAGTWSGSAAPALGLEGEVAESQLRAVLSKHDPRSDRHLDGSVRRARVPGFDLRFSVPKSASILFGIGDGSTQRAVLGAQAVAVEGALEYLEKYACRTRRGTGGYEIVPGDGFVGAAFRRRTSRAGDPQVHTHVLIANATRIADGTWGSLDGRAIYAEARTAGFIHEAVFRRELSERLGVSWTQVRNGIAEVEGVPRSAIEAFSRRRAEIDAQVEAWGCDTAKARQSAAVQTRRRKDYDVTPERLAPRVASTRRSPGLDARRLESLMRRPERARRVGLPDGLVSRLISDDGSRRSSRRSIGATPCVPSPRRSQRRDAGRDRVVRRSLPRRPRRRHARRAGRPAPATGRHPASRRSTRVGDRRQSAVFDGRARGARASPDRRCGREHRRRSRDRRERGRRSGDRNPILAGRGSGGDDSSS